MQFESQLDVGTADFCRNFPKQPQSLLARDNLFEHIETVFKGAARCILIEGEAQSGKSELLAGYMRKHPQESVGVFLSPGDTYFYSPEYARIVLAEQIFWILNGTPGNFESLDEATYKGLLYRLQKVAKQRPITFVLDGLAEKSALENRLRSEILNIIPFSQQDFRFLISGSTDIETDLRTRCKSFKSVPLIQIAQEEASEFLSDIPNLSMKDISDIRKYCTGSIGRLTKFKSIIQASKMSLDEILNNKSGELEDLMEMEWSSLERNEFQKKQLAFLCFANRPLQRTSLATFTSSNQKDQQDFLERSPFIAIDSTSGLVAIKSIPQKNFLRKQLQEYEDEVQSSLLKELLTSPESIDSDRYLPAQLMRVGKYDDLVKRLDTGHFCRLLNSEKSLRALRANLDLGLKAAKELGDDALVAQFGMGKSAVGGITLSVGSQSRIETLVTMGHVDEAIELSLAAPTREERLKHLAATAKALFDEQKVIPNSIRTEIRNLLDDLSIDTLGNMASTIACDLIVVDLEAAVELFNKANAIAKNEKTANIIVNNEKQAERATDESTVGTERSFEIRMSERHHRRFAQALGQMVDRISPEKLCARVRQSTEYSGDLIFLKEWIGRRRTDPGAYEVANTAIDVVLKDLTRSPRIEDLRAIAVVLPHVDDILEADRLCKRIQTLVSTDMFLGNSVEAIRLRMLLAETQYRVAPDDAELALLDILLEAEIIEDLGMRLACLSWMLYALKQFPCWEVLENKTSLISHTTAELIQSIKTLLQNSADHFAVVKTALPALARADVELALQVSSSMNTEIRRDLAYSTIAGELFILMRYTSNPDYILRSIRSISDENLRSTTILNGLSLIVNHLKTNQSQICNEAIQNLWRNLRVSNYRFIGLRYAIQISMITKQSDYKIVALKDEILKCWKNTEIDWVRWELGYSLVRDTYPYNKEYAEEWLAKVVEEEKSLRAPSESVNDVLKLTASLAVRAYSYLAPEEFQQSEDFGKLANLISALAVPEERLLMWSELGIRLFYTKKIGFSKHICKQYVEQLLPIVKSSQEEQGFGDELMWAHAAPFIYLTHESTGYFAVDKISCSARRDSAISDVCFTLLRKVAKTDVYKDPGNDGYEMDAQTAASIITLMGKMSTDWIIFNVLEALTNSLSAKKNERKFRRVQVADFLSSIEALIRKTLPDSRNIKHLGYLISSLSLINRARQSAGLSVNQKIWIDLFSDARKLTNVSDRAVVTAFVAVGARGKSNIVPENWLELVKQDVIASPTVLDQIDRYAWLAAILEDFDKKGSLTFARLGMSLTKNVGPDVNIYDRKRKLLDIVFNIDSDLAEDFIELADGDRARKNEKAALEARIKLQRLQKEAASDPEKVELNEESDSDISELSMRNLSALNANRIIPRAVEDFKNLNARAAALPFESAYSVWSWILENAIRKGGSNSKGGRAVSNAFNAAMNAGELVISLLHGAVNALNPGGFSRNGLVRPGGREDALALIVDWAKRIDGRPIVISDPYFGPDDVDLIFEIAKAAPHSNVRVLTGRRHLMGLELNGNFEAAFADAWRSVCDATASDIEICVIGVNSDGDHPIHDRWFLSQDDGLRLGTSAKSLGNYRVSEVSNIEREDVPVRLNLVNSFLDRTVRVWEGSRITVSSFSLY